VPWWGLNGFFTPVEGGGEDPAFPAGALFHFDAQTIVGAEGDSIALWENSDGAGADAENLRRGSLDGGETEPILRLNAINGLRALEFDAAVAQFLKAPGLSGTGVAVDEAEGGTLIMLYKPHSGGNNVITLGDYGGTGDRLGSLYHDGTQFKWFSNFSGTSNPQDASAPLNEWGVYGFAFDSVADTTPTGDNPLAYFFKDGVLELSASPFRVVRPYTTPNIDQFIIGGYTGYLSVSYPASGLLAEVFYYPRKLNSEDIAQLYAYLVDKYAL
jgi:hypothetical protein